MLVYGSNVLFCIGILIVPQIPEMTFRTLSIMALAVACSSALAEGLDEWMLACRDLGSDEARLACYDAAVDRSREIAPGAPATQEETAPQSAAAATMDAAPAAESLTAAPETTVANSAVAN